jgi:endonuclease YncB( thermonuclease family)
VKVRRVIDGDTLTLENGEDVRLIGVDTPETKHPKKPVERFGKEAAAFTKRLVEGQEVQLEYNQQRKDKYGRVCLQIVGMWSTEYPVESQGHWTFLQEGPPWTTTAS